MDFSIIAVFLLTFVWTTAIHIYEPPSLVWILLILGAVFMGFIDVYSKGTLPFVKKIKLAIQNASLFCVIIFFAQAVIFPFYYIIAPRIHDESILAAISSFFLNIFGIKTIAEGSRLYIDAFGKTILFTSNIEKTGLLYFILFVIGAVVCLAIKKAKKKHYIYLIAITIVSIVVRYIVLIMLYLGYNIHSIFWERTITIVTFLPYVLILAVLLRQLEAIDLTRFFLKTDKKTMIVTALLAFLLIFSEVSFFSFEDIGKEKQGRVLVEEYHSDWEWTTEKYDDQWFGERSGYNYYCFFDYLDKFYDTKRNMNPIQSDTLKNIDVFIIKTPSKPFSEEEVNHIISFVEKGGGLYLIGDHTNVFGTSANINEIAGAFGITYNYDCTYELVNGSLSEYDAPKILPHPVVNKLPHFLFASSNTLGAKWQAKEAIIGYGLKNFKADYSQKNFFPADTNSAHIEFGLFLQSVSVQQGKGRVIAFTDSTVFSNFWMFMPGKPELLINSVEWLNRENNFSNFTPRELLLGFFVVMLIINGAYLFKNKKRVSPYVFLLGGLAGLIVGVCIYSALNNVSAKKPVPMKPMVNICFEKEYSNIKLPANLQGFLASQNEQLSTFYVWTQRLGYFPSIKENLTTAINDGDVAVVVKPNQKIKNPEKIMNEIEDGANLFIIDHLEEGAHSNELLKLMDMEIVSADMGNNANYDDIKNIPLTNKASAILGGTPIIKDENDNVIFSVKKIGEGQIAVFSDPDLFYNVELGDVSANLTEKTKILTDLEFKIMRMLVNRQVLKTGSK